MCVVQVHHAIHLGSNATTAFRKPPVSCQKPISKASCSVRTSSVTNHSLTCNLCAFFTYIMRLIYLNPPKPTFAVGSYSNPNMECIGTLQKTRFWWVKAGSNAFRPPPMSCQNPMSLRTSHSWWSGRALMRMESRWSRLCLTARTCVASQHLDVGTATPEPRNLQQA